MSRNKLFVLGVVVLALGMAIFALNLPGSKPKDQVGMQDIKKIVNDYSAGNLKAQAASITSDKLMVTNEDESKQTYTLPKEEFFVSIAPYIEETHPCATHNLTGCRGELADKEFDVYIEDEKGNKIIDQTMKSHPNGFIDIWVPRDQNYKITISRDGKTAVSEFSTYDNDDTCISTMQLM